MFKHKKMASAILATVMVSSMCTTVFARSSDTSSQSDENSVEEPPVASYVGTIPSGDVYTDGPTKEEQIAQFANAKSINKEIVMKKLSNVPSTIIPRATTWSHLPGTYLCYIQAEEMFCAMACAQASMNYLTGYSEDQYDIMRAMGRTETSGATLEDTVGYLNNNQTVNPYVIQDWSTDIYTMKANLYDAVTSYQAPATLSIWAGSNDGWPWTSSGHEVNVNAARDDKAYFQVADPMMGRLNSSYNSFYSVSSTVIHNTLKTGYIF